MINEADDQLLEAASVLAYGAIEDAGEDLRRLSDPVRTIFAVYHATGIIENGGFLYFFDSDFPHHPPYQIFIDAYREIGCPDQADALQQAVDSFQLPEPEKAVSLRQDYMETHFNGSTKEVDHWNDRVFEDGCVWPKLAKWIRAQPDLKHLQES